MKALVTACMLLVLVGVARAQQPVSVEVSARLDPTNKFLLLLSVTNVSNEPLTVYDYDLPWIQPRSITLVAVTVAEHQRVLQLSGSIQDPLRKKISLLPGATISGALNLRDLFRELEQQSRKSEVIVFWSYQLITADNRQSTRRLSGVTVPISK